MGTSALDARKFNHRIAVNQGEITLKKAILYAWRRLLLTKAYADVENQHRSSRGVK